MHKDASQIQLDLETNVYLDEKFQLYKKYCQLFDIYFLQKSKTFEIYNIIHLRHKPVK